MNKIIEITNRIKQFGLVPTSVIDDIENAIPMADAICRGGLPLIEVTMRTDCAAHVIERIKNAHPEMLVGAGTVLNKETVDKAIAAGAQFVVSPGLNPRVVDYCLERDIPIIPGCITPSEIELALEMGLSRLKFFPAEPLGGVELISQMTAPYSGLEVMPTGGINEQNFLSYLACKSIFAVGAGYIVERGIVNEKRFDLVEQRAKRATALLFEQRNQ